MAAAVRPVIAVVYDQSAVTPAEIATGLDGLGRVLLVVRDSPYTRPMLPLLREMFDVLTPARDHAAVAAQLRAAGAAAVLTFSERTLRWTADLAEALVLPFHSRAIALNLTDKNRQRAALRSVDPVRSVVLRSPDEWAAAARAVGLPAIVKPLTGEGSRNTHRADSERAGLDVVRRLLAPISRGGGAETELVVEEFLTGRDCHPYGDYVSVESVVSHGVVSHLAVTGKLPLAEPFREVAQFWPADLPKPEQDAVLKLTTAALGKLGVQSGLTHTEIKRTATGPRIIEVNGRLGGWINDLSVRSTGRDLVELAGRVALGEHVTAELAAPGRVYFQYNNLPPRQRCTLTRIEGAREVRAMPNVENYKTIIRPGTELSGGVETQELDMIRGSAPSHTEMFCTLDAALAALSFTFTAGGDLLRLPASTLGAPARAAQSAPLQEGI